MDVMLMSSDGLFAADLSTRCICCNSIGLGAPSDAKKSVPTSRGFDFFPLELENLLLFLSSSPCSCLARASSASSWHWSEYSAWSPNKPPALASSKPSPSQLDLGVNDMVDIGLSPLDGINARDGNPPFLFGSPSLACWPAPRNDSSSLNRLESRLSLVGDGDFLRSSSPSIFPTDTSTSFRWSTSSSTTSPATAACCFLALSLRGEELMASSSGNVALGAIIDVKDCQ
mmetsp:Transcript_30819/g.73419  ORF Transcript_30819/g.73419 Transcript_30819/m.73419 type:complete len:229 (+) Transcript_30819:284-970(+)